MAVTTPQATPEADGNGTASKVKALLGLVTSPLIKDLLLVVVVLVAVGVNVPQLLGQKGTLEAAFIQHCQEQVAKLEKLVPKDDYREDIAELKADIKELKSLLMGLRWKGVPP